MKIANYDKFLSEETKKNIIKDYVENNFSIRDLVVKYNVKSKDYLRKTLLKGLKYEAQVNHLKLLIKNIQKNLSILKKQRIK